MIAIMINFFKNLLSSPKFKSFVFLSLSILLLISLLSYDITHSGRDISLGFSYQKLLSFWCTNISEILIQLFGIASFIFVFNFFYWSFLLCGLFTKGHDT